MHKTNDPRIEPGVSGATLPEQDGRSVADDVVLPDYVMLDFVDDFVEPSERPTPDAEIV